MVNLDPIKLHVMIAVLDEAIGNDDLIKVEKKTWSQTLLDEQVIMQARGDSKVKGDYEVLCVRKKVDSTPKIGWEGPTVMLSRDMEQLKRLQNQLKMCHSWISHDQLPCKWWGWFYKAGEYLPDKSSIESQPWLSESTHHLLSGDFLLQCGVTIGVAVPK